MFDFVTIDFETANEKTSSACQIGIAAVKDSSVVKEFKSLIRPKEGSFRSINTSIHGITEDMVRNSGSLDELWPEIMQFFSPNVPVIAHSAGFDMSVLKNSCTADIPAFYYADSLKIVKPFVSGRKGLAFCAAEFGVCVDHHHDAADDARVCAEICIEAFKRGSCLSAWEFFCKYDVPIYCFSGVGINNVEERLERPSAKVFAREHLDYAKLQASAVEDKSCPLCGKNVVFTGDLSIGRGEAAQLAADHGAIVKSGVSRKTDFLIVGKQDVSIVGDDGMSNKEEKAHALNADGANIVFLSEADFFNVVNKDSSELTILAQV